MTYPLVTIAMPVYNDEAHLDAAIDSVLSQTYRNIEFLICDDASKDRSLEKALSYAEKFSHIKVLSNDMNIGVTGIFNRLRSAAAGKYVMLRSSNDLLDPAFTEEAVREMERDPEIGLCYARTVLIDKNGSSCGTYPESYYIDSGDKSPLQRLFEVVQKFTAGDINYGLIRNSILRRVQQYGWFNGPDHVFIAELAYHSKIKLIDSPWNYRRNLDTSYQTYRLYCSRRTYRSIRTGIEIQPDPFLMLNFVQMAFQHCEMIANTEMPISDKALASDQCLDILRQRFSRIMEAEVVSLLEHASNCLLQWAAAGWTLNAFNRSQMEELERALQTASLVFPEDRNIGKARNSLIGLYGASRGKHER